MPRRVPRWDPGEGFVLLTGGRSQEVAAPAAPLSILGHKHGNILLFPHPDQRFPRPVSFLVVPFVIYPAAPSLTGATTSP